jgi:hypothetical protein
MGLMATGKHDAKQIGLVTLYFFVCFGIILTLKKQRTLRTVPRPGGCFLSSFTHKAS